MTLTELDLQYWCSWCGEDLPDGYIRTAVGAVVCGKHCHEDIRRDERRQRRSSAKRLRALFGSVRP